MTVRNEKGYPALLDRAEILGGLALSFVPIECSKPPNGCSKVIDSV